MVRSKTALIIRLICSLALIVAAMPLKASASTPCVKPAKPACGMPCCQKSAKVMACETQTKTLAKAATSCDCEVKSAPATPATPAKALAPSFEFQIAVLPTALPELTLDDSQAEPGIYGIDSGPPPHQDHPRDLGRAPPVARA